MRSSVFTLFLVAVLCVSCARQNPGLDMLIERHGQVADIWEYEYRGESCITSHSGQPWATTCLVSSMPRTASSCSAALSPGIHSSRSAELHET